MLTPKRAWFIPHAIVAVTCLVTLAACGDDSGSAGLSTLAPTSVAPSTTAPPTSPPTTVATTVATTPPTTAAPTTKPAPTTPAPSTTAPGEITVTVGVDDSPDRVETVKVGTPITLRITNPDADDEFHVHVVDLGDGEEVPAGVTKTFKFTLSEPASIEVESHHTHGVLLVIDVVP